MVRTNDLYLASFLKAKKFKITRIDKESEPQKTFFEFNEANDNDSLLFYNNELVPSLDYREALLNLKRIAMS